MTDRKKKTKSVAPLEVLQLNCRYLMADGADVEALGNDVSILFDAAMAVFELTHADFTEAHWAGYLALKQAHSVWTEYHRTVEHNRMSKGVDHV